MKYMYILFCIMSSFFTYKSISAKENFIQYAFFMPQNTLQENTTINEFSPLTQDYSKNTPSKPKKIKKIIKKKVLKKKNAQTPKHKKTFPVVKSELKNIPLEENYEICINRQTKLKQMSLLTSQRLQEDK